MTTIANCLALLLLTITMIVFFSIKYHLSRASHYYSLCLISTWAAASVNTFRIAASTLFTLPSWGIRLCGTLDFFLMILTTSILALYLISKICEHITEETLYHAKLSLAILLALLSLMLSINLKYGFIFFSPNPGEYVRGPAYILPFAFIFMQTILVLVYCTKYRKALSKSVKLALLESLAIVCFCLLIQSIYKNTSVFALSVVLIELIFFLNFQNHRIGVNSLTNLNGSRSFFQELTLRIKKQAKFKVYLIKLQNLSVLRQLHGHKTGDELLYLFAFNLEKLFSNASTFNLQGATFTLVLPHEPGKTDSQDVETLISFLASPVHCADSDILANYVMSEYRWDGETDPDVIYEQLENAVDVAREAKLKYALCSPELYKNKLRRQYLIQRMQTIRKEEGFELWFQPIFNTKEKDFPSMEVLLRLKEKDGTYISPAEFIPLAEKTGQIIPITWFVIEEACRVLADCSFLKGKRLSINLPMAQLNDPSFDKKLDDIVDRYDIPHDQITFEFTERVIIEDLGLAERNMRRLARSGYTFCLDDFGTGYSNFNCVLQLPLKTIKLDMSITSTLSPELEHNNLVYILNDLFHDMGLQVVAEGAETEEQIRLLRAFGVDGIQGYYYAKPMPLKALQDFFL